MAFSGRWGNVFHVPEPIGTTLTPPEGPAYSKLSKWPGGGVVGIHGTDQSRLFGHAVSHGCVRVSNAAALALKRLASLGTPIHILPLALRKADSAELEWVDRSVQTDARMNRAS